MKIVFMGTPQFACAPLRALHEAGYEVSAVITQPDRPRDRGHKLTPPPVKTLASELGVPVYQCEKIRCDEPAAMLEALAPDLAVTAAFGQILSARNLAVPALGTVNVHASLLPKYRGAAPIEWCIMNGEKTTGVTTMYTDVGLDTGDMILSRELEIAPDDTTATLTDKLSVLGAQLLVETVALIAAGTAPRTPQNEAEASYYPMLRRETAHIDFTKPAARIRDLVRAMNGSITAAYALMGDDRVRVFEAQAAQGGGQPGAVLTADAKRGLTVACGDGAVRLAVVQLPGGRAMADCELLRGRKLPEGAILG